MFLLVICRLSLAVRLSQQAKEINFGTAELRWRARPGQGKSVWLLWLIWFVLLFWFIWLVSSNQKNQTNEIDQTNQIDQLNKREAGTIVWLGGAWP